MAEAICFAIFAPIRRQFGYLFCFNTNIQNLETQLDSLKVTREGVQLGVDETRNNFRTVGPHLEAWLTKANDNTAEAETIIKDKAQVQKGCFNGWCPNLKLRYSLGRKAVKNTQELALLRAEGSNYIQLSYNPPTTTIFQGFDSQILVMNEIIEALKDDGIHLIGICGMGGIGKTTMAKEVAKRTKFLFNEFPMTVFSEEPNFKEVQSRIAEMLGLQLDMENPIVRSSRLRERLLQNDKKILVILDDIWEEFDLEELGFPLEGGSNSSCKILFTSRNRNLWKGIQNKRYIQLQVLVGDEPWHLFREKVGDCADNPDLLPLAKQIVNECGGLPLALVTIGRALTNEHQQHHWNNALQQLRTPCSESLLSEVPAKVYQALYFSYNFLKDERAKKLFLLCCLFPEDYDILIEDLVRYGIGLRWLGGIDKVDEVRDQVNDLVDQLKSCFLLLDGRFEGQIKMHHVVRNVAISIAAKDKRGFMTIHGAKSREWPTKATNELNTSISVISNEIVEFPGGMNCSKLEFLLIQCWNSSLKIPCNFFEGMGELQVLDLEITNAISLLPSSLQFLSNLLTLHLDHCQKFDNISVIGKLLNLEILSFRESNIEELPEEIGGLVNLKLLDLTGCYKLERIAPGVISALVQLQELYMVGCRIIWEREGKEGGENASLSEFESLSDLNTLEITIKDVVCLPRIQHLKELVIRNCATPECLVNTMEWVPRTSNAIPPIFPILEKLVLSDLPNLRKICHCQLPTGSFGKLKHLAIYDCDRMEEVIWKEKRQDDATNKMEFPALESMTLKSLPMLIGFCGGTDEIEFPQLKKLRLEYLPQLKSSNSLLRSIAVLHLTGKGSEDAVQELLREGVEGHQHLKILTIRDCDTIECLVNRIEWVPRTRKPMPPIFPILEKLVLSDLPNLRKICDCQLPTGSFGKLKHLETYDCDRMEEVIWKEKRQDDATNKMEFPALESMTLKSLPMLSGFCRGTDEIEFPQLKKLHLEYLPQLKSSNSFLRSIAALHLMGKGSEDVVQELLREGVEGLQHVKILTIRDCDTIECLVNRIEWVPRTRKPMPPIFPILEKLVLSDLPNLRKICHCQLPTGSFGKLKHLDIYDCDRMEEVIWKEKGQYDATNNIKFPALESMTLKSLPMLIGFCRGTDEIEFPQLKKLHLEHQPELKSSNPSSESMENHNATFLSLFPHMVAFPALKELLISGVPNITEICGKQFPSKRKVNRFEKLMNAVQSNMLPLLQNQRKLLENSKEKAMAQEKKRNDDAILFPQLRTVRLDNLQNLETFCRTRSSETQTLFNHQIACPELRVLAIGWMPNITDVWDRKLHPTGSFCQLREVRIEGCDKLVNVIQSNMLPRLQNLRELSVQYCPMVEEILSEKGEERADADAKENTILFPQLKRLELGSLENLKSFCTSRLAAQHFFKHPAAFAALKELHICNLPNVTEIWGKQLLPVPKTDAQSFEQLAVVNATWCEKLVNVIPSSMFPRLKNLKSIYVKGCPEMEVIVSKKANATVNGDIIYFPELSSLSIDKLYNLKSFCSSSPSSEAQPLFNDQVVFPILEDLFINRVRNITNIWDKLHSRESFCFLKRMMIEDCEKLVNVVPSYMLPQLRNLEVLNAFSCPKMLAIVSEEEGKENDDENTILFPNLTTLNLKSLDNLKTFHTQPFVNHQDAFAALEELHICNLPNITEIWGKQLLPVPKTDAQSFKQLAVVNATWCEKLVNVIPSCMFPRLKNLKSIYVKGCPEMEVIVSKKANAAVNGDIICFPKLSSLSIDKLENIKSFCSSSPSSEAQPLFNDQVVFPILEDLFINRVRNITNIWDKLHSRESFCFLKRMMIEDCEKLVNVVPSYMLPQLRNLEVLNAFSCPKMLAIVSEEEGKENDDENTILFPNLTTLNLKSLDNLKTFHTQPFVNHQVALPELKNLCLDQYLQQRLLKGKECAIMNDDKEIEQDKQRLLKGMEREIMNENDDKETEQDKRRRLKGKEFRNYE